MYTLLIKDVDKTSLVMARTLSIYKGADNRSDCSFSLATTSAYLDIIGHDIKIKDGETVVFGGIIKNTKIFHLEEGKTGVDTNLRLDVNAESYNDVCARRTINCGYTNAYAGDIVSDILTNVLNSASNDENIIAGTISDGKFFTEYSREYKSVKDIFDELADASGYKWYIDDSKTLHFISEDTITDATYDIMESGSFKDFKINGIETSLVDYRNKQFVVGGFDNAGIQVSVIVSDDSEITARESAEGSSYSSGVYGNVIYDGSIETEAEAGIVAENALKKNGIIPQTIEFRTFTNEWIPGTRVKINLPTFGVSADVIQSWNGYPDSPVSTLDYPYQAILDFSLAGGNVVLALATTPLVIESYNVGSDVEPTSGTGSAYLLIDGVWVSGGAWIEFTKNYLVASNNDIYYRGYDDIYFSMTDYPSGLSYFLVESVTTEDLGGAMVSTVTASKRKPAEFSTQRAQDYKDYFAKLVQTSIGNSGNGKPTELSDDLTPQLGGELDQNGHSIGGTEYNNGDSGTSKSIDWRNGNHQKVTLTGDCAFTFTAPSKACMLSLRFIQDSSGSHTKSLPTIKWPSGIAPTWTIAANSVDILSLFYDGASYYGQVGLAFA